MKKNFVFCSGVVDCLGGDGTRRFFVLPAGASTPHPPIGTPTPFHPRGNSAPARTLVAGLGKSERSGEHRGQK